MQTAKGIVAPALRIEPGGVESNKKPGSSFLPPALSFQI